MNLRVIVGFSFAISLSGCASYFTARSPVIEDKVGLKGQETVGTLATSPDYRVVYVRLQPDARLCAEAPADAGAQFGSSLAAGLDAPTGGTKVLSAEAKVSLAVAMKQLFKRSQGVQLFRDGSFALCNMHLNNSLDGASYLAEIQEFRRAAVELIKLEIQYLEKITIDPIDVPVPANAPNFSSRPASVPAQPAPHPARQPLALSLVLNLS